MSEDDKVVGRIIPESEYSRRNVSAAVRGMMEDLREYKQPIASFGAVVVLENGTIYTTFGGFDHQTSRIAGAAILQDRLLRHASGE